MTVDKPAMPLDHSKLAVYQYALDLVELVDSIMAGLPSGTGRLKDQLDDAATSIVANIAEGAGEFSPNEKKRFYRIARRSVNEVAAWLDILARRGLVAEPAFVRTDALMTAIVSMLVKMTR